jgi:hypothetical protein
MSSDTYELKCYPVNTNENKEILVALDKKIINKYTFSDLKNNIFFKIIIAILLIILLINVFKKLFKKLFV